MSKMTIAQRAILDKIRQQLNFWEGSNDLHSPSHSTDIDSEINAMMLDDLVTEEQADHIAEIVANLWVAIADLNPRRLGVPGPEPPVGLSAVSPGKAPEDAASPRCISGPHAESAEQIRQQYERGIQEGDTVMEAKPIDAPEHFMAVADGHRIRIPVRDNNMLGEVILCDHITELSVARKMLERLQAAIRTVEGGIPPPPPGRIIHEGKVPPQP